MTAEEIRDACLSWLRRHNDVCKDPDCLEPANLLGYLCHCMGLTDIKRLTRCFVNYDMTCGDPNCSHETFRKAVKGE